MGWPWPPPPLPPGPTLPGLFPMLGGLLPMPLGPCPMPAGLQPTLKNYLLPGNLTCCLDFCLMENATLSYSTILYLSNSKSGFDSFSTDLVDSFVRTQTQKLPEIQTFVPLKK